MPDSDFENLQRLLGGQKHRKLEVEGYPPLVVEVLEDRPLISLCHYGVQNGDLVRDPEIVFLISGRERVAKPVYYRNDYVAVEHATVEHHFGDAPVNPRLQKSLDQFVRGWFTNLKEQGFFDRAVSLARDASEKGHTPPPVKDGPDFVVRLEGSFWLFSPITPRAHEFVERQPPREPWPRVNNSLVVDDRLAPELLRQLGNEHLSVGPVVRTLTDYIVSLAVGERHTLPHEHEQWTETRRRLKDRVGSVQEVSREVIERFEASAHTRFGPRGPALWHPEDESPSVLFFRDGDDHFARQLTHFEMDELVRLAQQDLAREPSRDKARGRGGRGGGR
jgi:hypothetical protein